MKQLISIPSHPSLPVANPFISTKRTRAAHLTASICIPARNEEKTISRLVTDLDHTLKSTGIVSEIVVLDDRSTDLTRLEAELAGATVYSTADVLRHFGPSHGKGDAMWRSLAVSTGDIVLWCDGDLQDLDVSLMGSLVQRLRYDRACMLAKGYFRRIDADGVASHGGRVTELAARPLLSLLFPDAAHIHEPLGGIYAMRRSAAESVSFESDYGVDVGLLIDTIRTYGVGAVAQIDLGDLRHRNQSLEALAVQAACVERAILTRSGFDPRRLGHMISRRDLGPANISAPLRPPLDTVLTSGVTARQPVPRSSRESACTFCDIG